MNSDASLPSDSNPYAPVVSDSPAQIPESARKARRSLRWTILILLPAAIFNAVFWDVKIVAPVGGLAAMLMRSANIFWFVVAVLLCWYFAWPLLGKIMHWIHHFLGRAPREQWQSALESSCSVLPKLAVPGCLLWLYWSFGNFVLDFGGALFIFMLSAAGHILVAMWYLPLFYHWYLIEQDARKNS
ncbi:MAG: hypothetical protein AAF483_14695 [Planctomycetota bacterium]